MGEGEGQGAGREDVDDLAPRDFGVLCLVVGLVVGFGVGVGDVVCVYVC